MNIKKVSLCLNVDDPEQKTLHDFVTKLPNGDKRNGSQFLKTLVDREHQRSLQKKEVIKTAGGGITLRL
ncbi:hypothetical protein FZC78_19070 [Rossellomorea vietnamensis]|uniref:Uncharacterized protein n=1 Tax=Rossellomorea vietnamensis TaxID=218284 RepID=A0A5D4NK74_9BACI|nr:hypothetical protein [Rossellomorea vietnamensis]TYS14259.1 hypothetical protein FZC78_19070 [Rossellomorea vietnamensis]